MTDSLPSAIFNLLQRVSVRAPKGGGLDKLDLIEAHLQAHGYPIPSKAGELRAAVMGLFAARDAHERRIALTTVEETVERFAEQLRDVLGVASKGEIREAVARTSLDR